MKTNSPGALGQEKGARARNPGDPGPEACISRPSPWRSESGAPADTVPARESAREP